MPKRVIYKLDDPVRAAAAKAIKKDNVEAAKASAKTFMGLVETDHEYVRDLLAVGEYLLEKGKDCAWDAFYAHWTALGYAEEGDRRQDALLGAANAAELLCRIDEKEGIGAFFNVIDQAKNIPIFKSGLALRITKITGEPYRPNDSEVIKARDFFKKNRLQAAPR